MNKHDQYFAQQRINLTPRATTIPLRRGRRRSPFGALALGAIIGASLAVASGRVCADPPRTAFSVKTCEVEAITARQMAQARDEGIPESAWHERLDGVAAAHPELALSAGDIRREHAAVHEIWALQLAPDTVFAFVLHRCMYARTPI